MRSALPVLLEQQVQIQRFQDLQVQQVKQEQSARLVSLVQTQQCLDQQAQQVRKETLVLQVLLVTLVLQVQQELLAILV